MRNALIMFIVLMIGAFLASAILGILPVIGVLAVSIVVLVSGHRIGILERPRETKSVSKRGRASVVTSGR